MLSVRGQGIGSLLISKVLEGVREEDVYLTTLASSKPLYTRFGFQELPQGKVPRCATTNGLRVDLNVLQGKLYKPFQVEQVQVEKTVQVEKAVRVEKTVSSRENLLMRCKVLA